jgi:hypothetical protein
MIAKFNFDFTGATITPISDINAKPTKYEIIPATGSGVPTKVEIELNPVAKCMFDVYYYDDTMQQSPNRDAPSPNDISDADYGCNEGYDENYTFRDLFSSNEFDNSQTKTVISKHKDDKNYCEFSVDMEDGQNCDSLNYCIVNDIGFFRSSYSCDNYFFANSDFFPIGSIITSIKVTCPSSPDPITIPYSYTNFTPTFDAATNILTFTPNDGTIGTQSLGVSNTTSVATNITDIDKWNGEFDMSFVCGNDNKLHTNWGNLEFSGCVG